MKMLKTYWLELLFFALGLVGAAFAFPFLPGSIPRQWNNGQVVATMPGISRSGSTICTGMLWGLQREFAVTYSFILGIPAVLGAIVLEVPDAVREGIQLPLGVILTGFFTSLVVGILAIRTVQWVVRGNKLKYFGWYTLALGTLTLVVGFSDRLLGYPIQQFFSSL